VHSCGEEDRGLPKEPWEADVWGEGCPWLNQIRDHLILVVHRLDPPIQGQEIRGKTKNDYAQPGRGNKIRAIRWPLEAGSLASCWEDFSRLGPGEVRWHPLPDRRRHYRTLLNQRRAYLCLSDWLWSIFDTAEVFWLQDHLPSLRRGSRDLW
jgi:hypothetical protein